MFPQFPRNSHNMYNFANMLCLLSLLAPFSRCASYDGIRTLISFKNIILQLRFKKRNDYSTLNAHWVHHWGISIHLSKKFKPLSVSEKLWASLKA